MTGRFPGRIARAGAVAAALAVAGVLAASGARAQGTWTAYVNLRGSRAVALDAAGVWSAGTGGAMLFPHGGTGGPQVLTRTPNGLTSNLLTAVHVTADGSVWFGTLGQGLLRWNRSAGTWTPIDSTFGLPSSYITRIRSFGSTLWVGTQVGLGVLDGDAVVQACAAVEDSCLPNLYVNDILVAEGGRAVSGVGPYFIATQGGVTASDGNHWTQLTRGLPPGANILALGQAGGTVYCAEGPRIYQYSDTGWAVAAESPDSVYSMAGGGGRLYVGRRSGVSVLIGGTLHSLGADQGARVLDLAVSGDSVWAATTSGVLRYVAATTRWSSLFDDFAVDQPAYNNIHMIRIEPVGRKRLWILPFKGGEAMVYDPSGAPGWSTRGTRNGMEAVQAWGLLCDTDGFKWFGHCCVGEDRSKAGIEILDDRDGTEKWRKFRNPPHNVLVIAEDAGGRKWLGAGDPHDALYEFVPSDTTPGDALRGWKEFTTQTLSCGDGLASNKAFSLAMRDTTDRWIGTPDNGLTHWRSAAQGAPCDLLVHYSKLLSEGDGRYIPGQTVNSVAISGDSVWVATNEGLAVIRASRDSVVGIFGLGKGLPENIVSSVAAAPNGDVWIGTGLGLTLFRSGEFTTYDGSNSPLVEDAVGALTVEGTGVPYKLWIGTALGLNLLEVGGGDVPQPPVAGAVRLYPHPFRPGVHARLGLAGRFVSAGLVRILDARGRTVREFRGVTPSQGFWDGRDAQGRYVGAGMYRVLVEADGVLRRLNLAVIR
ncbi:MAG: hypothetical protein HZB25_09190 [Candidatus Eisenbacteria bacterium]|nr:hypothetical protein [Candidatus Eisenbacteria bacterium]